MSVGVRFNIILLLLCTAATLLASCENRPDPEAIALPYYGDSLMTPMWVGSDSATPEMLERRIPHRIGDLRGFDQTGRDFDAASLDGTITVVDFFFTRCPNICPTLTENMARVQEHFADASPEELQLLSLSVTPEIDSVPVLDRYAERFGVDAERWRMVTGEKRDIYHFARTSLFADVDTTEGAFLHSETFYLLGPDRRIRGIYNGTLGADIVNLIGDIETLMEENKNEG